MIDTFAYNKDLSRVNAFTGAPIVRHPPMQYMAICEFDNVYWEFDSKHNYAPCLVFDGKVERLDSIDVKFPRNVDSVFFNDDKPLVQYRYNFNEEQLAVLAQKGFWSETGVDLPSIFTSSKFQLETDVVIEEVVTAENDMPIFNVELVAPYGTAFDATAYELVDRITRRKPETNKIIENAVQVEVRQSTTTAVKEAEEAMAERERQMQEKLRPMSKDEMEMHNKSANIGMSVGAEREELRQVREEGNARAEAEREAEKLRIEAEREALAKLDVVDEIVANNETAKLVGGVENNKYSSNNEIFNDTNNVSEPVSEKVAALMKKLSASTLSKSDEKKDDKPDTGSGAASGAQGLGVYTFEDQDAAQVAMRADEGHGNEKPIAEEEKETTDAEKSTTKFEKAIASSSVPKIEHEHGGLGDD